MGRRLAGTLALLLAGCVSGPIPPPVGRAYPDEPATYVELIDADAPALWQRVHQLLEEHHIGIRQELFANNAGYILCEPFTVALPGTVNLSNYSPGEIVATSDGRMVNVVYGLEIYLSATDTRLVRLWVDADASVLGYLPHSVRVPDLPGAGLLEDVVQPLQVVKEWRKDRPEFARKRDG